MVRDDVVQSLKGVVPCCVPASGVGGVLGVFAFVVAFSGSLPTALEPFGDEFKEQFLVPVDAGNNLLDHWVSVSVNRGHGALLRSGSCGHSLHQPFGLCSSSVCPQLQRFTATIRKRAEVHRVRRG